MVLPNESNGDFSSFALLKKTRIASFRADNPLMKVAIYSFYLLLISISMCECHVQDILAASTIPGLPNSKLTLSRAVTCWRAVCRNCLASWKFRGSCGDDSIWNCGSFFWPARYLLHMYKVAFFVEKINCRYIGVCFCDWSIRQISSRLQRSPWASFDS